MRTIAVRLRPGEDLLQGIDDVVAAHDLQAAIIVTAVGSLSTVALRYAGRPATTLHTGDYEIQALVGTCARAGAHLHLTVAAADGQVVGGHAMAGNVVRTTAEIVLGELEDVRFIRPIDSETGWDELEIVERDRE